MEIQCPAVGKILVIPDPLIQIFPKKRNIPVLHKKQHQIKLLAGQRHRTAVFCHPSCFHIDRHISKRDHLIRLIVSAQNRFHSGRQLRHVKRLDQIIVGSQFQSLDPVLHFMLRRDKDHRHLKGPDIFHHIISVRARQHDIQKHQVKGILLHRVNGGQTVLHCHAGISCRRQIHLDQVADRLFIIHYQYLDHICTPVPVSMKMIIQGSIPNRPSPCLQALPPYPPHCSGPSSSLPYPSQNHWSAGNRSDSRSRRPPRPHCPHNCTGQIQADPSCRLRQCPCR